MGSCSIPAAPCSKELTSQFPATGPITAKETGNKTGNFACKQIFRTFLPKFCKFRSGTGINSGLTGNSLATRLESETCVRKMAEIPAIQWKYSGKYDLQQGCFQSTRTAGFREAVRSGRSGFELSLISRPRCRRHFARSAALIDLTLLLAMFIVQNHTRLRATLNTQNANSMLNGGATATMAPVSHRTLIRLLFVISTFLIITSTG
jgi:hypothetical protein